MTKDQLEKEFVRVENALDEALHNNASAKYALRVLAQEADNPVQKMCYLYLLAVLRGDASW